MLAAARAYAVETWGRLPNFFVSRVTTRFDNGAQVLHAGEFPVRIGLHPVSTSTRQITFREGKEVLDSTAKATPAAASASSPANASEEIRPAELGRVRPRAYGRSGRPGQPQGRLQPLGADRRRSGRGVPTTRCRSEASHYMVTYSYLDMKAMGRTQFGYSGRQRSPQQMANIPKSREAAVLSRNAGLSRHHCHRSRDRRGPAHHHRGHPERRRSPAGRLNPDRVCAGLHWRAQIHLPGAQPGDFPGTRRAGGLRRPEQERPSTA